MFYLQKPILAVYFIFGTKKVATCFFIITVMLLSTISKYK